MELHQDINILPSQIPLLISNKKEVLFSGGYGSGKSLALCVRLVQEASIPGSVSLLVRKHLTSLKRSTLRMLLEPEGTRPPILPLGTYKHNKVEGKIELYDGGTILYMGCEDPLKIRSVNVGAVFLDEALEISEKEYIELLFRIRINVGCLQLFSATNPGAQHHFLYKRFVTDSNEDRQIIYGNSLENVHLPDSIIKSYKQLKGDAYSAYVEGRWVASERQIYRDFDYDKHTSTDILKYTHTIKEWIVTCDWGYKHPSALLLVGVDGDHNMYVFEEFYKNKLRTAEILERVEKWKEYEPRVVVDPSSPALVADFEAHGWTAQKANNAVEIGISRVRDLFDSNSLLISQDCVNLIKELQNYSYDEDFKVIKVGDDACDSLRYGVNYVVDLTAIQAKQPTYFIATA